MANILVKCLGTIEYAAPAGMNKGEASASGAGPMCSLTDGPVCSLTDTLHMELLAAVAHESTWVADFTERWVAGLLLI